MKKLNVCVCGHNEKEHGVDGCYERVRKSWFLCSCKKFVGNDSE